MVVSYLSFEITASETEEYSVAKKKPESIGNSISEPILKCCCGDVRNSKYIPNKLDYFSLVEFKSSKIVYFIMASFTRFRE